MSRFAGGQVASSFGWIHIHIFMIYNMIRYAVCVLKFMFTEEKGQTHKEINVMRLNKSQ